MQSITFDGKNLWRQNYFNAIIHHIINNQLILKDWMQAYIKGIRYIDSIIIRSRYSDFEICNICKYNKSDYITYILYVRVLQSADRETFLRSFGLSSLEELPELPSATQEGAQMTMELAQAMNEVLSGKWGATRGLAIVAVGVNSVTASAEDEATIKELQKSAVFRNTNMAAAHMVQAQAEAMKTAAGNKNGAMMGFMGMNMAQSAGGFNAASLFQMGQQQPAASAPAAPVAPAAGANTWKCSCGAVNTGKFCVECGASKPADGWVCSCGAVNKGKFCSECGAKKPASEPLYRCDKCGWEPEDPKHPPKFCPECGDKFDDEDIR